MGQKSNYAVKKGAQIRLRREVCATDMVHIAMQTINPLHLDRGSSRLLQLNPSPMSMLLDLQSEDKGGKASPKR